MTMTEQPESTSMGVVDMDALIYEAPSVMTMHRIAVPVCGPKDVLVRVAYSGICGSELSGFLGQSSIRRPPLVFGHEVSGYVEAVGSEVEPVGACAIGTAVTVNPLVSCGDCTYCVTGRQQLCAKRLLLGASLPGCNAEFVRVPASGVLAVPSGLDITDASMVEPAAFAMRAVELSGIKPTSSALVIGAGAIGLFLLQVLGEFGVKTRYVAEKNPARLKMATDLGCIPIDPADSSVSAVLRGETGGDGVDVAFDAVGSGSTRRACLMSLTVGGTLVLVGLHSDETELPLNTVVRSEIKITGAFAYSVANFRNGLDWLASGRLGLKSGVVVAPLSAGPGWYQRLVDGDPAAKVLLRPGGSA